MKHQWYLHPESPGDARVLCESCGLEAMVINRMIGQEVVLEDCPAAVEGVTAELVATPTLVQVDEDLWVNPANVFAVRVDTYDERYRKVLIVSPHGASIGTERSLDEVVALINGSTE